MNSNETITIIRGGLVPDFGTRTVQRKDLRIQGGLIISIDDPGSGEPEAAASVQVVDASGALVVPGFVNTHTHSYGPLARQFGSGLQLEPWMMFAWSITVGRTSEEVYVSALLQGLEALQTGTTTVLDHLGGDAELTGQAARAYWDLGIRAAVAPMISDIPLHKTVGLPTNAWPCELEAGNNLLTPPPAHEMLAQTKALHREWNGIDGRISVLVGPSAPQRCSAELLDGCAALSSELDTQVHTHLLESRAQGQDPKACVDVLDRHGLVSERLIGAHGVWVSDIELERLGEAGASLVHNPQSNLQLGSGMAQVHRWRHHGVIAALGTDGANCGGSLDMLSSMRFASVLHHPGIADERRWESPWSALEMATSGGARALGMHDTGRLEVGCVADVAIFAMDGTAFAACEDPVNALVLSATSSLAKHVLVGGRVVIENGNAVDIDEAELLERAGEASRAIIARNQDKIQDVALAQRDILVAVARGAEPRRDIVEFEPMQGDENG